MVEFIDRGLVFFSLVDDVVLVDGVLASGLTIDRELEQVIP